MAYLPFLIGIGFFCYFKIYPVVRPMVERNVYDWKVLLPYGLLLAGMLLVPAVLIGFVFRFSRTHHGFMLWVNQRQKLGQMIINNRYYLTKKHTTSNNGKTVTKDKISYFPKIYYQRVKGHDKM
jgi:predicted membrane chloride channel (bestrophin family)